MDWLATYWPMVAFAVTVIVLPIAGWAIRMGLASKGDLADEAKARAQALQALEGRLIARFDNLSNEQGDLSDRTLRIETEIRHLPSAEDIAELKTSAARTETQVAAMSREFSAVGAAVTRIENTLMKGRAE